MKKGIKDTNKSTFGVFTQNISNDSGEINLKNISFLDVENDGNVFVYECPVCHNNDKKTNTLLISRDNSGYKYTTFTCPHCKYNLLKSETETIEHFNGYRFSWDNRYDKYNCVKEAFIISDKKISAKQVGYIQAFFNHRKEALTLSKVDYNHGYNIDDVDYLSFDLG